MRRGGTGMNTNERATLKRWIKYAWLRAEESYGYIPRYMTIRLQLIRRLRWAKFAQACENRIKAMEEKTIKVFLYRDAADPNIPNDVLEHLRTHEDCIVKIDEKNREKTNPTVRSTPLYHFEKPMTHRRALAEKILLLTCAAGHPMAEHAYGDRANYAVIQADRLEEALAKSGKEHVSDYLDQAEGK
jgi:hypothetical protein